MSIYSSPPVVDPVEVEQWRRSVLRYLVEQGLTTAQARQRMQRLEFELRDLASRLHERYGTPHLGNYRNPTDEFVYIVLSRKTAERAYRKAFYSLTDAGSWDMIAGMSVDEITRLIFGCGLEPKKARALKEGFRRAIQLFGRADLVYAASLSDHDLFDFLKSLPEVGPKSALCVMLFSFGRTTFPVDAHVGRVLARIGVYSGLDLDLKGMNHKMRQARLAELVPPDLRYSLHVNLIAHGRAICKAPSSLCGECFLKSTCACGRASESTSTV